MRFVILTLALQIFTAIAAPVAIALQPGFLNTISTLVSQGATIATLINPLSRNAHIVAATVPAVNTLIQATAHPTTPQIPQVNPNQIPSNSNPQSVQFGSTPTQYLDSRQSTYDQRPFDGVVQSRGAINQYSDHQRSPDAQMQYESSPDNQSRGSGYQFSDIRPVHSGQTPLDNNHPVQSGGPGTGYIHHERAQADQGPFGEQYRGPRIPNRGYRQDHADQNRGYSEGDSFS